MRIVRIEIKGLLQFIFRSDVLHLVKRNLTQQAVSAGIFSVLLKDRVGLLAGLGVLSRRNEQVAEAQSSIQILGIEIYSVRERLSGGRGILLLDLEKPQAVVSVGEIRIDLNRLLVFALCRGELRLREVLISFFDVFPGPRCTPASR